MVTPGLAWSCAQNSGRLSHRYIRPETAHAMAGADIDRSRRRHAATIFDDGAAIGKSAAGGQIGKLRHGAGDGVQPRALSRTKTRASAEQALRIGMSHAREHGIR